MKVFEEEDAEGNMMFQVEIGDEVLIFPSKEEREKFLFRLWMDLLQKMLRARLLREALEWLWEQREEDMQKIMKQYFSVFVGLLLPLDSYLYSLPPTMLAVQVMTRNLVEVTIDLILQAPPPAPALKPSLTRANNMAPRG